MTDVRIRLFGRFEVSVNGRPVANDQWRGQMPRMLLQFLAARPDGKATGDELIEALWSHLPAERARHNLRVVASRLRALLAVHAPGAAPAALLPFTGTGYRLPESTWTDLGALRQHVADVRRLQAGDPAAALVRLEQVELPEPDTLLPEQPYADWAIVAREQARQGYIALQLSHADLLLAAGRMRPALERLRLVLALEPVRESAARLAMQIAVHLGDRVAALDIFDRCRRALAEELGVDPMPETLALHTTVLQADTASAAPAAPVSRASGAPPGLPASNLPVQPTSFVGRQAERAAVQERFAGTRLLTLTGAGGSGKTRLALQVAADLLPARAGGVWLVELAALADPELVPVALASALGLEEQPERSPLELVAEHVGSKGLLLVLDNCEHLVGACAVLADTLLRACPDLWILATSREALAIGGESLWPVPPLRLPDPRRLPALERLLAYDAVALFVERAAALVPGFTVTAENAATIARICRRLDGIPLAIELAAALVKVLSVDEIDARLHERFRLLTAGSRMAPPRQKTLRGAMEWSHDLLSAAEQTLWRRLSVFAGGFTLAAAEAVCSDASLAPAQVLELLQQLADKSLVIPFESGGERRFRLLETIREYGVERLRAAAEETAVRTRHFDWCRQLAEGVVAQQWGPQWADGYERLEREHDNLRAALDWSRSLPGGAPQWIGLAWLLIHFWDTWGHVHEGRQRVAEFVGTAEPPLAAPVLALALTMSGLLAIVDSDLDAAVHAAEPALTLWRELGDQHGMARCLLVLGQAAHHSGQVERAVALLEESLALFRAVGDGPFARLLLHYLAEALVSQGEYRRAQSVHEECLALRRAAADRLLPYSLLRLARLAALQGDPARAVALQRESLPLWDLRFRRGLATSLEDMAAVALSCGQAEQAACLAGAADALRRSLGLPPPRLADREQVVAGARTQLGEQGFAAAWSHGQSLGPEQAMAYALNTDHTD